MSKACDELDVPSTAPPVLTRSSHSNNTPGRPAMSATLPALKTELKNRIYVATSPYKSSGLPPAFSSAELIVMMLVTADRPLSIVEIVRKLVETFKYYNNLAVEAFCGRFSEKFRSDATLQQTEQNLKVTMKAYDLPISQRKSGTSDERRWTVSATAARVYLTKALGLEPTEAFSFLQLPPELRQMVYEMVLQYPRSGLQPQDLHHDSRKALTRPFVVRTREIETPFSFDLWSGSPEAPALTTEPLIKILSIAQVSKQLHQEASKIFFQINTFYVRSTLDLADMVDAYTLFGRLRFGHIAINYPGAHLISGSAFKLLRMQTELRAISIKMDEKHLASVSMKDEFEIPGIPELRQLRGLKEVTFVGKCPKLAATLPAEMMSAAATEDGEGTKKRKTKDAEDDNGAGSGRAKVTKTKMKRKRRL